MAIINKHYVIAQYTPGDPGVIGAIQPGSYTNAVLANAAARDLAAQNAGAYYVVYEAEWFAFTNVAPVAVQRVGPVGSPP